MERSTGLVVIVLGIGVVVVGAMIWSGALGWFGRLPGDIRAGGEHTRVFVPITSMLVVSIVLTVAINLVARLFR